MVGALPCQLSAATLLIVYLSTMAVAQVQDTSYAEAADPSLLQLCWEPIAIKADTTLCDIYADFPRPIVFSTCRRPLFGTIHELSHPDIAADLRLIANDTPGRP